MLEPLQALREVVRSGVGSYPVRCALSQHGAGPPGAQPLSFSYMGASAPFFVRLVPSRARLPIGAPSSPVAYLPGRMLHPRHAGSVSVLLTLLHVVGEGHHVTRRVDGGVLHLRSTVHAPREVAPYGVVVSSVVRALSWHGIFYRTARRDRRRRWCPLRAKHPGRLCARIYVVPASFVQIGCKVGLP